MQIQTIYLVVPLIATIYAESNTVTVFTEEDFNGQNLTIDVSNCINLSTEFDDSISSVDLEDNCINLYKDIGCLGKYIVLKPGTPYQEDLSEWIGFDDQVSSIGPCYQECDSRNIETRSENISHVITLYDRVDYKGYHGTIDVKGCTHVPKKLGQLVESIKFDNTVCIELHEHIDCTGKSIQLRTGSPAHNSLSNWGLGGRARAVSLCGFKCYRHNQVMMNFFVPMDPKTVTLYDDLNFDGRSKNLKLGKGCLDINDEWEGESGSIRTYGQCVIIYEHFGCSPMDRNQQLNISNEHVHQNLQLISFEHLIRSIQLCPSKTPSNSEMANSWSNPLITSAVMLFLIGLVIIASVIIVRLRRSHKRVVEILTEKEIEEFIRGFESSALEDDAMDFLPQNQPYDQNYEIPKSSLDINMKSILGKGEYAIVYKGHVRRPSLNEDRDVAVKTVKPYSGIEYVRAMLKEIKTMIYVGQHSRIVELVGCCTQNLQNAELSVMTELCENGSLEKFLQNNREGFVNIVEKGQIDLEKLANDKDPVKKGSSISINIGSISSSCFNTIHLLQLSMQIAEGMEFLCQKKVIHGDLAARNVLLDSNFNVKISDFGLSRQLYEYTQYVKKNRAPLPWRWLAIESLKSMTFSTESDIWAFGITIWEIFTLGEVPYPGMVWDETFLYSLTNGFRLSKPTYTTSDCYNLMISCWRDRPSDRMSFQDLRFKFWEMLELYSNVIDNTVHNKGYVDFIR